eukprot:c25292_g1_i1 orf=1634-2599(-)
MAVTLLTPPSSVAFHPPLFTVACSCPSNLLLTHPLSSSVRPAFFHILDRSVNGLIRSKFEGAAVELPPASREESILQAKISLAAFFNRKFVKRRKLQTMLRLRVEIPLLDDSPAARAALVADLLGGFWTGKRGDSCISFAVCADNLVLLDELKRLEDSKDVSNLQFFGLDYLNEFPEEAQVVVSVAPAIDSLSRLRTVTRNAGYRPVVVLNPDWLLGDEKDSLEAEFIKSFEVVYSFTALSIQSFFSKKEGAVFKYVRRGAPAGEPWLIFVKEGDKMKCVSSLSNRPTEAELQDAFYSSVASGSPITKSIKFIQQIVGGSR